MMEPSTIAGLLSGIPGGAIAAIAIWFAIRKDNQCSALMAQLTEIARGAAVSNQQVVNSIDAMREAIKQGTRT